MAKLQPAQQIKKEAKEQETSEIQHKKLCVAGLQITKEEKQQEISEIQQKKLFVRHLKLKHDLNCDEKEKTFKFGDFAIDKQRPSEILLLLIIIDYLLHPQYDPKMAVKLTGIKLNGNRQLLKLGSFDDVRPISIANGFGHRAVIAVPCILCAKTKDPTYGVGSGIAYGHAKCVKAIKLPQRRNNQWWQCIFVDLSEKILNCKLKTPQREILFVTLIWEILGKSYDVMTNNKSVSKRKKLFKMPKDNNNPEFDWNVFRGVQNCDCQWNAFTDKAGLFYQYLS